MDSTAHPTHFQNTDSELDLGEAGCGQLLMEILLAMRPLAIGQRLLVTAHDPAAAGDIAAWCRMTGNSLIAILPDATRPIGNQFLLQKGPDHHAQ